MYGFFSIAHMMLLSFDHIIKIAATRACPQSENGDKNKINGSQTRKIVQIISIYYLAI